MRFLASIALPVAVTLGILFPTPHTASQPQQDTIVVIVQPAEPALPLLLPGDDDADGYVDESESGWDCSTMGNQQCTETKNA